MKSVALAVSAVAISVTMVACSGGTPTAPSQLPGVSAVGSASAANGEFGVATTRTVVGSGLLAGSDISFAASEANILYNLAQLGQLAHQRGDKKDVKEFGKQLFQDFSNSLDELGGLAGDSVARGATFDAGDRTTFNTLRGLSGSEFDRAFVAAILTTLTSNRTSFTAWSTTASSSAYRTHSSNMSTMLSRFLTQARDVETFY